MSKPYTYLIGWSVHNKWYYGCQYGKKSDPSNLWTRYFTSSKEVRKFVKEHGDPDIIEVRKTFADKVSCRLWEHKVLRRLKVVENVLWLNQTDNISIDYDKGVQGALKAADMLRGKKQSEEHKLNRSKSLMGHNVSEETRRKIAETRKIKQIPSGKKGKKLSDETKLKISQSMKNRKRKDDTQTMGIPFNP